MKKVALSLVGLVVGALFMFGVVEVSRADVPPVRVAQAEVDAGAKTVEPFAPAGSGSAVAPAPTPADTLANPVDNPIEAYSDLKAAKKLGWAFAILAAIVMLAAAIGRASVKWPSAPGLSWFNKHKTVIFVVAGIGATATAAFNALSLGGSWFAVIGAAGGALLAYISALPSEAKA